METPTVRFAQRMGQLPPYLFGMINRMKMEKRWNGKDVIDLGMGNPVDPTPKVVIDKLCEVAQDPKTHRYPVADGLHNLRKEIAVRYAKDYDVHLDSEEEVICTIGSKEGLSHLCLALVENEHRLRQALRQMRRALPEIAPGAAVPAEAMD